MELKPRWFVIFFLFVGSACTTNQIEPTAILTPRHTNTDSPTPTDTQTITPSPSTKPTYTPSPTPTPIGGSGLLVLELHDLILKEGKEGKSINEYEDVNLGVFLLSLHDSRLIQIFPGEYHLEGISPNGESLLISKETELYSYNLPSGDLIPLSDFFYHQPPFFYDEKYAFWVSEFDRIFFLGKTNNRQRIFSIKPDGSDPQLITNTSGNITYIDSYANGNLYWVQESPMYWDRKTNLDTMETQTIYWGFLNDTEFSQDGRTILDWHGVHSDFSQHWIDPLIIGFKEIEKNEPFEIEYYQEFVGSRDQEITLRGEFIILAGEPASVRRAWWNPDSNRILLCIDKSPANEYRDCNEYFLLDRRDHSIEELQLTTISFLSGNPRHFHSNTWSPDGTTFLFWDGPMLVLYNVETKKNIIIQGNYSAAQIKRIYWIQDGDIILDQLNKNQSPTVSATSQTLVEETEVVFSPITATSSTDLSIVEPKNTSTPHSSNSLPSYVDIIAADYSTTNDNLEITMTLRDLQEELPVNREGVCDSCWEYLWGAFVDNDKNRNTGGVPGLDVPVGWEYALLLVIDHESGSQPEVQSISERAFVEIWEVNNFGGWNLTISPQSKFHFNRSGNTITISGNLSGISVDADLMFYAFDYNPDGIIFSDYYIPAE